jgi:hypothetical protein
MRCRPLFVIAAAAIIAVPVFADDKIDVKAVVDKAIKAHGGKEALEKFKVTRIKGKGTISAMGNDIEFTVKGVTEFPDKMRSEIKLDVMGQSIEILRGYDGKTAWQSLMGNTMELDGAQLDEMREEAHHNYLENIFPLATDKSLELSAIGEEKVDNKPAIGLKITKKDHKEIRVYFDKESGLLVKMAYKTMDMAGGETNAEAFYRDYKDVQGTKVAMKQEVKHGGEKFLEATLSDVKLEEKTDAKTFEKP